MKHICIAIDGPASSGKSTVAKLLAQKFSYVYLDTGAMYRCITLACLRDGIDLADEKTVYAHSIKQQITFQHDEQQQSVYLNGEDVTNLIRQADVTNNVSLVSSYASVREHCVDLQRAYIQNGGIVMDGRDIGTVVMPNAQLKIFMVASVEQRALRRYKENQLKKIETDLATLEKEIAQRDLFDSTRENSPLVKAEDAIEIDTTHLTILEVVEKISEYVRNLI